VNAPTDKYAPPSAADVARLIKEFPLAWIVSAAPDFLATPLPLRPRFDDEGRLLELHGHYSRGNPQVVALRSHPRALVMFMGPQGYVSQYSSVKLLDGFVRQIAALGFGNVVQVRLPRVGEEVARAVLVEPVDLPLAQQEDAAQHEPGRYRGRVVGIGLQRIEFLTTVGKYHQGQQCKNIF